MTRSGWYTHGRGRNKLGTHMEKYSFMIFHCLDILEPLETVQRLCQSHFPGPAGRVWWGGEPFTPPPQFTPPPHLSDLTENGLCGTAREHDHTNYCQTMLFSHNHDHSAAWQCPRPHLDGGRQISTGQMNTALFTGLVLSGSSSQAHPEMAGMW